MDESRRTKYDELIQMHFMPPKRLSYSQRDYPTAKEVLPAHLWAPISLSTRMWCIWTTVKWTAEDQRLQSSELVLKSHFPH